MNNTNLPPSNYSDKKTPKIIDRKGKSLGSYKKKTNKKLNQRMIALINIYSHKS